MLLSLRCEGVSYSRHVHDNGVRTVKCVYPQDIKTFQAIPLHHIALHLRKLNETSTGIMVRAQQVVADVKSECSTQMSFSRANGAQMRAIEAVDDSSNPDPKRQRQQDAASRMPPPASMVRRLRVSQSQSHTRRSVPSRRSARSGIDPDARREDINPFYPGMIIRVAQHETAQDPHADSSKPGFIEGEHGMISSKYRPGVVMWVYDNGSIMIVPVSSHQGNDLDNKNRNDWQYHMLVGYPGTIAKDNFTGNTPWFIEEMRCIPGSHRYYTLTNTSSVDITNLRTPQYNECMDIMGHLTRDSTKALLNAY